MMTTRYQNKRILIIGLGISGRSAARFLLQKGAGLIGVDRNLNELDGHVEIQSLEKAGMEIHHDQTEIDFSQIELVILSPGISALHPLVQQAVHINIEVIGEIELGCRHVQSPVLGITGTNGKTTVTLLVQHVLTFCGFSSQALGNVGTPFTQEIDQNALNLDAIVLELSSYQLETMEQKVLDAGLILNITPDHLDRYKNMFNYAKAKARLGNCLKLEKPLFIEYQTWQDFSGLFEEFCVETYGYTRHSMIYSDLRHVYFRDKKVFELPENLQGQPSHDLENLMGAYGLCTTKGISGTQFIEAFKSFKKPPHRIQFVRNFRGVDYYDDSKGTNIEAVIRAVQSLKGPIILIAGGLDKGASYQPWISQFKDKVKNILVIGQASNRIQQDLNHHMPVEILESLESAVSRAAQLAKNGDSVLLSPGCASQDMFKDYIHRGEVFQQVVKSLAH